MSYKEQLYENSLKVVSKIYEESKYDPLTDLYRSIDIINGILDLSNTEWLVNQLIPYIKPISIICVLNGSYGITASVLKQSFNNIVDSVDPDPGCIKFGKILFDNIRFHTGTAEDWFIDHHSKYHLIICTNAESIEKEDLDLMIALKKSHTTVCFQSSKKLDLNLSEILFEYEANGTYTVIGK